jgi:hypothetical protein
MQLPRQRQSSSQALFCELASRDIAIEIQEAFGLDAADFVSSRRNQAISAIPMTPIRIPAMTEY